MFGTSAWKEDILKRVEILEIQSAESKKTEMELRSQTAHLQGTLKNLGRKLVLGLPVSIESLEKGLNYDLVFAGEVEAWSQVAPSGRILDIRSYKEFSKAAIPGALCIPYDQLSVKLESLSKNTPLLIVCENGIRSVSACEILTSKGFNFLYVIKGGMNLYEGPVAAVAAENGSDSGVTTEVSA